MPRSTATARTRSAGSLRCLPTRDRDANITAGRACVHSHIHTFHTDFLGAFFMYTYKGKTKTSRTHRVLWVDAVEGARHWHELLDVFARQQLPCKVFQRRLVGREPLPGCPQRPRPRTHTRPRARPRPRPRPRTHTRPRARPRPRPRARPQHTVGGVSCQARALCPCMFRARVPFKEAGNVRGLDGVAVRVRGVGREVARRLLPVVVRPACAMEQTQPG